MGLWIIAAAAAATAQPADGCSSYVGQTVSLNALEDVADVLKQVPTQKDEYETTAAFDARVAAARASLLETAILAGTFLVNM